ncbi:SDR family oxidoreductase, partial [Stenotrophomonas sp. 3diitr2024]|uniref:SDR family oxidoreductase n=1 Tax=Stenotrophomonas sp. 3diitr2024 TaxID=3345115 RepID=UPI0035C9F3E4
IHAFTKALASQLLPRGIRVNCVAPGPVWTPLNPADKQAEALLPQRIAVGILVAGIATETGRVVPLGAAIEVPAFSRTVERRRIGQRWQRAATGLHCTWRLPAEHAQGHDEGDALWLSTIAAVAVIAITPLCGALSDRLGRRP